MRITLRRRNAAAQAEVAGRADASGREGRARRDDRAKTVAASKRIDTGKSGQRRGLDPAQPAVLARYARWRQGDNAMAARAFSAIGAMYRSRFPGLPSLRDAGLRLAGALPPLRRQLVTNAAGLAGRVPDRCRKAPASAG